MKRPRILASASWCIVGALLPAPPVGTASVSPAISPVPDGVSQRVAAVQVRVIPDHLDWTYALGQRVRFRISVTADNEPIEGVTVSYVISSGTIPGSLATALVPSQGLVVDSSGLDQPGFLRCVATCEVAGQSYRGLASAAFAPTRIQPTQANPEDFDFFWSAAKAELASVPLAAIVTLVPDACTSAVNVYQVSFRTVCPSWVSVPARVYGILCEPKAPGRYPAVLELPGAGVRSYAGDKDLAARGMITLQIGIHNIPVDLPHEIYDCLGASALRTYWYYDLDDPHEYYYRRVYLGCLRAADFLATRPHWNGKDLIATGGSQGGQLAIVTAALDPRVSGVAAMYPAYCDVTGDLHGRPGGFPWPFRPDPLTGKLPPRATPANIATTAYYDTVNFARRIKVPTFFLIGFNDEVAPPISTFCAYNVVSAPKRIAVALELGHASLAEASAAMINWIEAQVGHGGNGNDCRSSQFTAPGKH